MLFMNSQLKILWWVGRIGEFVPHTPPSWKYEGNLINSRAAEKVNLLEVHMDEESLAVCFLISLRGYTDF